MHGRKTGPRADEASPTRGLGGNHETRERHETAVPMWLRVHPRKIHELSSAASVPATNGAAVTTEHAELTETEPTDARSEGRVAGGRGVPASWFGFTTKHTESKPAARRTRAPPRISPMARIKNDPWHPCDPCPSEDEARCLVHDGGWLEGACARIASLGVNSWLPPPSGLTTRAPRAAFQPRVATARRAPAGNPDRCGARSHRSS